MTRVFRPAGRGRNARNQEIRMNVPPRILAATDFSPAADRDVLATGAE